MVCIYIDVDNYLRDWLINSYGASDAIAFHKGSAEAATLRAFLRRRTLADAPDLPGPASIAVRLPQSKDRDPATWNVLSGKGRELLLKTIKARFDAELFADVFPCLGANTADALISAWMEAHGIEINDTNFQTVLKRFNRRKSRFMAARRQARLRAAIKSRK
ncbi:MAG: hypothetical protein K2O24_00890 [Muribaculaceae bacterium]|nr:hypothetical protein [Muribaculaceae bacterium]